MQLYIPLYNFIDLTMPSNKTSLSFATKQYHLLLKHIINNIRMPFANTSMLSNNATIKFTITVLLALHLVPHKRPIFPSI